MTTWRTLSELDKICFRCPLPQCDESNPDCPHRLALAAGNVSRQKPALRQTQVLDYLNKHPGQHQIIKIADAIGAPYKSVMHALAALRDKDQATTTGQRRTRRWAAKDSP